jgi:hypothetical protein
MMHNIEVIAGILGVFFLAGIIMGMLLVVVLPLIKIQLKSFHEGLRSRVSRRKRKYMDGGDWQEPEPPREDDEKPPWYRR